MINFGSLRKLCIIGGGTAGWFAALHMRRLFNDQVEITVISNPEKPIVGVGEGGILNLIEALQHVQIPLKDFMENTGAVHKLGFAYEGWRTSQKDDLYYHMFPALDDYSLVNGFHPVFSILANHGIPISQIADSIQLREKNISQDELTSILISSHKRNFGSSFHFDAFQVSQYLRTIALGRNIRHIEDNLLGISRNSLSGDIEQLHLTKQTLVCDFVIDASGFSRLLIEKELKTSWHDLSNRLVMNKAIPFHLPHRLKHPDLVTRSTALSAGWVWQIPLQHRIGAGYVFNDQFINPTQAISEVEQWLGHEIVPQNLIDFKAGYFEKIWSHNVLSVGLSSGFVEPLEATSIGQMLLQLRVFDVMVKETQGIINQQHIDFYNRQNTQSWEGIADFIRMHYDTPRADTPFWKFAKVIPMSEKYRELKACWKHRSPRHYDIIDYEMDRLGQFGVYSWFAIAQSLGHVSAEVTANELVALSTEEKHKLIPILSRIKAKLG